MQKPLNRRTKSCYAPVLCGAAASILFSAHSEAAVMAGQPTLVTLDTASLVADSSDMPLSLSVQFNSGGTAGVSNNATLSNFQFDGGSAGINSTVITSGDVTSGSSLNSSVMLDTNGGAFSSFSEDFTPGQTLTFVLNTSLNLVDPSIDTPDLFAVQILDSAGNAIPTVDPDTSNSLLVFTYSDPFSIGTYSSDITQTTTAGQTLSFAAPVLSAVPEPSSLTILIVAPLLLSRRSGYKTVMLGSEQTK